MSQFDENGKAYMVDVTDKEDTLRTARAFAKVVLSKETLEKIKQGEIHKGEVLTVAKIAGIMSSKKTSELIPLCHPLNLTFSDLTFRLIDEPPSIEIESFVELKGKTGAEMEALTSVSIAALTIYDMCKSIDKNIEIREIYLLEKTGGKSGNFRREKKLD
ncbi:cyclic pyranopterin monophosphate synthase MoaC [Caldisericum exile]|uniref:Cyclic pyranopterin monophosphate synthase n=1 Tax=Caldisericum exile (strain DSM 21853 / NBRC 104410 / AZM16c01) TaxID=511051 RepID=A0A7U6JF03_CALEA|nr:cyclic pyranopterin monophosphate synthase MoaC [Caldisericum exile]BAL81276.1 molybdenum cofactor biosynthesis protein C [Caldisericum exile AZM16c01]